MSFEFLYRQKRKVTLSSRKSPYEVKNELMNFKGKKVIVTGGGSGIGKAIAIKLAELKANVY